jgi:hypothetical protein
VTAAQSRRYCTDIPSHSSRTIASSVSAHSRAARSPGKRARGLRRLDKWLTVGVIAVAQVPAPRRPNKSFYVLDLPYRFIVV